MTPQSIYLAGNLIKKWVSEAGLGQTITGSLLFHRNKGCSVHENGDKEQTDKLPFPQKAE